MAKPKKKSNAVEAENYEDEMALSKIKNRRVAPRRDITPLQVSYVSAIENLAKIAKYAEIIEASTTGFLMLIKRDDLVPLNLRRNLTIDSIVGTKVILHLPQMNIEISGRIARTQLKGKIGYEVGIDYTEDSPEYWRECLLDLLPLPGEFDSN